MNDDLHIYVEKAGENISLTQEERDRMRSAVHAYMAMKPLRRSLERPRAIRGFEWWLSPRPVAALLALALFVSCTGISYAAENALPGDALYPIKININEPIAGALASSASAKAVWAASVANERLKEAAILAAEGKLSTSTAQQLQTNFETHAQQAAASINAEASTSPDVGTQTAVRFDAQLSAYQQILSQISAATNASTTALQASITTAREHVATARAFAESRLATSEKATSTIAAAASFARDTAREQLAESLKTAHDVSDALSSSSAQSVALQLEDASATIVSGNDLLGKNAAPQALGAFQSALGDTERLGVFLQTSDEIHKRTGKVIGDPGDATSTPADNGHLDGHGSDKSSERHAPFTNASSSSATSSESIPATTSAATSSATTTSEATTTTETAAPSHTNSSGVENNSEVGTAPNEGSSNDNQNPSAPSVLPISVPTQMFH